MFTNLFRRPTALTDFQNQVLVLAKPDAVFKGQVGMILTMFEHHDFRVRDVCELKMSRKFCREHYRDHIGKPFFKSLVDFMSSGLTVGFRMEWLRDVAKHTSQPPGDMILCARNRVERIRKGHLCVNPRNMVHASDSLEAARRELQLWFPNSKN